MEKLKPDESRPYPNEHRYPHGAGHQQRAGTDQPCIETERDAGAHIAADASTAIALASANTGVSARLIALRCQRMPRGHCWVEFWERRDVGGDRLLRIAAKLAIEGRVSPALARVGLNLIRQASSGLMMHLLVVVLACGFDRRLGFLSR